jgi:uncharacterized protein (DUF1501 family)
MIRRDFLKLLSLSAATLAFPRLSFAFEKGETPQFFVLIRMQNGWDVTLGLDPKDHALQATTQTDMFLEYAPSEILRANGLALGPAMAPMMRHSGGFSVVNGIITATTDNGHTANLEYMSSGNGEGKAPYLPAELANSSQAGSLGLVFSGQTNALDRDVMVTSTSNVVALKNSLNLSNFKSLIDQASLKGDFYKAQQAMLNDSVRIDDLNRLLEASKIDEESDAVKKAGKILAATFASGTAYQGQIDLSPNLDSHASHEGQHLKAQTEAWEQIASVFDIFKSTQLGTSGVSVFDRTVFMVISEFSRTPSLNTAKGKDHNPLTNSALFAGGLIRSGQTFGKSHVIPKVKSKTGSSSHTALPIDFATGSVASTRKEAEAGKFEYMTPEILVSTVAHAMSVDWAKFKAVKETTPVIRSLLK